MPHPFELIGFGSLGWGRALVAACGVTIAISVCGFVLGMMMGAGLTIARVSGKPVLSASARIYTTVVRSVPELLVLYLLFFGASSLISSAARALGETGYAGAPAALTGIAALALISAAYIAEVLRGAWTGIGRGQIDAARALGLSRMLLLRKIVAPQLLRLALPGLGNVWQLTLKESALISLTGLTELMRQSAVAANATAQPFLFYGAAAALYLLITTLTSFAFNRAERLLHRGQGTT